MDTEDRISRRRFLNRAAMLAALAAAFPAAVLQQRRAAFAAARAPQWRDEEPWQTLAAVQEHLFPAGADTPGADDIQALVYLRNTLENPLADSEHRQFIVDGVGWLNELARQHHKQSFAALHESQRETLLRQIEKSRAGRRWLSKLLTWLLEALLADPVYGGNPDGLGWRWLEHQPGFPAPPQDKTWYRLGSPVHYRRKA